MDAHEQVAADRRGVGRRSRAIDAGERALLEGLAEKHLTRHGGDAEKSVAALNAGPSIRESIARLGDPVIEATLARIAAGSVLTDPDPDRTISLAVGSTTSAGQRFRILRPHAQGGLGAVFVALDAELNREVALKQILEHHADDATSRTRFVLEAEITGGLEHPGIVPVYGLGASGNGRPYYAMRFIKGNSLKDAIAQFHTGAARAEDPGARSLGLRELLRRFIDVCNAIDYAHGRGVVHGDRSSRGEHHRRQARRDAGRRLGPGQADGAVGAGRGFGGTDADAQLSQRLGGDAARIGAGDSGLHEPRAGRRRPRPARAALRRLQPRGHALFPPDGEAPVRERRPRRAAARTSATGRFRVPPPQLDPSIDRALDAVCLQARMATKIEGRYASCRALAADIERWTADEPVSAYREPLPTRLGRWGRRHRSLVAGAAVLLISAVVGLAAGAIVLGKANARTERQRRSSRARQLRDGPARRRRLPDAGQRGRRPEVIPAGSPTLAGEAAADRPRLSRAVRGGARRRSGGSRRPREIIDPVGFRRVGGRLEAGVVGLLPTGRRDLGGALLREERPRDRALRAGLADACIGIGNLQIDHLGEPEAGHTALLRAHDLFETLVREAPDSVEAQNGLARACSNLARWHSVHKKTGDELAYRLRALETWDRIARDHPEFRLKVAGAAMNLGYYYVRYHDGDAALKAHTRALEILKELAREAPVDLQYRSELRRCYTNLGYVHQSITERFGEALIDYNLARDVAEQLAQENPTVISYRESWASGVRLARLPSINRMGRFGDSVSAASRAVAICEQTLKLDSASLRIQNQRAEAASILGESLVQLGRRDEAARALRDAIDRLEPIARAYPTDGEIQHNLSRALNTFGLMLGRAAPDEALAALRRSVEVLDPLDPRQRRRRPEPGEPLEESDRPRPTRARHRTRGRRTPSSPRRDRGLRRGPRADPRLDRREDRQVHGLPTTRPVAPSRRPRRRGEVRSPSRAMRSLTVDRRVLLASPVPGGRPLGPSRRHCRRRGRSAHRVGTPPWPTSGLTCAPGRSIWRTSRAPSSRPLPTATTSAPSSAGSGCATRSARPSARGHKARRRTSRPRPSPPSARRPRRSPRSPNPTPATSTTSPAPHACSATPSPERPASPGYALPKDAPDPERRSAAAALDALRRSIAAGYSDAEHLSRDTDFDSIRDRDAFATIARDLTRKKERGK